MKKIFFILGFCIQLFTSSSAQNIYDRKTVQDYFQNQDFEKAVNYLCNIPDELKTVQFFIDKGYSLFMLEKYNEAKSDYLIAYQKEPQNLQANLYLADIYNRQRKYDSSLLYYQNLILLQPGQYKFWQSAATCWDMMKENDSAFIYIKKSYSLNPKAASVAYQYAEALQYKKLSDEAETVINNYLKADSSNELIISKRIDMSFKSNKYKDVIFWGKRLLLDSAIAPGSYTKLAFAYLNTGQSEKSLNVYNWLDVRNMNNESVKYCAALAYARMNNFVVSNQLLGECIDNNILKDAKIYYRAKADNFERLKLYSKAIAYFDTSYYIFQDPIDLFYAGSIYDRDLKNRAKAIFYYKKYMLQKTKSPNESNARISDYIKEYLKPQSQISTK